MVGHVSSSCPQIAMPLFTPITHSMNATGKAPLEIIRGRSIRSDPTSVYDRGFTRGDVISGDKGN